MIGQKVKYISFELLTHCILTSGFSDLLTRSQPRLSNGLYDVLLKIDALCISTKALWKSLNYIR